MATIIAGAIGNCVHVAGVVQFLRIAEELGYQTYFLGAAVPVEEFVAAIRRHNPDIVGVSFRLTPEVAERLLNELKDRMEKEQLGEKKFVFGGTPPVCQIAEQSGLFDRCFSGLENVNDVLLYLGGGSKDHKKEIIGDDLPGRLKAMHPYPLLRHHFGLSDLEITIKGVEEISRSGILDIISLAPDQNAQESMFRPQEMDPMLDGAGGVPVRSREDLVRIKAASQTGNRPLLRIYSGTRDLIPWAELGAETINNAWGAIPLCWYNALDGRSKRSPEEAICENQKAMGWYGARGIPLEVNEAHHWSLRDAHDTIAVVMAYLAAYNAKARGIKTYVAQYMFNSPPMITPAMDLAKMLAKIDLIESLHDENFVSYRQVRAGLLHLSPRENVAKGQLAASTAFALQIKPDIVHVVGYCEGDHAATAPDVIESCEIVHGVLKNCLGGQPDYLSDPAVIQRKNELLEEAQVLLHAIQEMGDGKEDPFTSPRVLAQAIQLGVLDAPHLKGNPYAAGKVETRCIGGALYAWDKKAGRIIKETERLAQVI
ncbi:cobalamin B12-binding domain-containing protein [Candidatus Formimonas warabiya]|uniref:Methionine synthase n=1 Tax=Formimonas warabiya TaxID=1761012 RepID=A0A3G1KMN2_FORW1|nr:cobalamin B12-binding domain-containing protein [Candidatus Formimonas warabiya]ATW23706.1 methionine synthase [Candidatus Formimonas warabiya]